MNLKAREQEGRDLVVGGLLSFGIHVLLLLVFLLIYVIQQTTLVVEHDEEERTIQVRLEPRQEQVEESLEVLPEEDESDEDVVEDESPADLDRQDREDPRQEEDAAEEEEEEPEEEDEEPEDSQEIDVEEAPLKEELMELYAVDQETNEEEPEEAMHVSDQANVTEEETVAEIRTLEEMEPVEEHEAPPQQEEAEWELAMSPVEVPQEPDILPPALQEEEPAEQEEEEESEYQAYREPSEIILDDSGDRGERAERSESETREQLFRPDSRRVDEVLGRGERAGEGLQTPEGRRLLSTWRDNEESLRASLENFLPHVETGNHTSVNARAGPHASYIARMHRSIHPRWALGFIPRVQDTYSNAHPLNDMSLMAIIEIVIDAETGRVEETGIVQTSGNTLFDAEALMTSRDIGPQPDPPTEIVSPDGKVYVHWSYWRDQRQCGTFGVRIYQLQGESERRAIPELDFSEPPP